MNQKRPIIVGSSGTLGRHLFDEARGRGLCPVGFNRRGADGHARFDAVRDNLVAAMGDIGEGHCVYLAFGVTRPDWVHAHPRESRSVNVEATLRLLDEVLASGARAVFLSTELVFDGAEGGYDEASAPSPTTEYGRQKLEVEQYLRHRDGDWIIIRTGGNVSRAPDENCTVEKAYDTLMAGEARMAEDNLFSLTAASDTVDALLSLCRQGRKGLYHFVAEPPVNRVQLANWIVEDSRFAARMRFERIRYRDLSFPEPRPLRSYMVSGKARSELGLKFACQRSAVRLKVGALDAHREPGETRGDP